MNWGEYAYSGALTLAVPVALLAGLVSFASPCVLPLVPGYLAYASGTTTDQSDRRRILAGTALFVAGFAVVFTGYGAAFGALGAALTQWQDPITRALGVIVIIMGVVFTGRIPALQRSIRLRRQPPTGMLGAPLLGIVFGLGWTPCFGPTLAAISALSLDTGSAWRGALLGFTYCLGLGIPFLVIALGMDWATRTVGVLRRHIRAINIAGGVGLILIGGAMVTGLWTAMVYAVQALMLGVVLPI